MTTTGNEGPRHLTVIGWLDTVLLDLKYTFRMLARTPGFTAVAILTLALGIGANTAIFTLLDQVLLRLLPVKDPRQLVLLTMRGRHYGSNWGGNAISHPMFRDFKDHNDAFSEMFCRFPYTASLTSGGQAELVQLEMVSGTYFSVLGVRPRDSAIGDCTFSCDGRRPRTERFGGGSTTKECIGCTGRKGWRCSGGGASDFEPKRGCRSRFRLVRTKCGRWTIRMTN